MPKVYIKSELVAETNSECIKCIKENHININTGSLNLAQFVFFENAQLDKIAGFEFEDSIFTNCHFGNFSSFQKCVFVNCKFKNCTMPRHIHGTTFIRCSFESCKIDCYLSDSFFAACTIKDSSVRFIQENSEFKDGDMINCDINFHSSFSFYNYVKSVETASCSFKLHGERGITLYAVKYQDNIYFNCGCFRGDEKALREYIKLGKEEYKKSRTFALETVLNLLNYKE